MSKPRADSITRGKEKLIKQYKKLIADNLFWEEIDHLKKIKNSKKFKVGDSFVHEIYMLSVYELCRKFNLPPYPWREVILDHVSKGKKHEPDFSAPIFDTCYLRVLTIEKGAPRADIEELNEHYPIAICLSPHATVTDLRDYIDKHKDFLDSLLKNTKTHEDRLFNMRDSYEAERNEIIMNLHSQGLTNKKIARVLADEYLTDEQRPKFGPLTADDVSRIVRRIKAKK